MKYGIDVSSHQGLIDWQRIKSTIDFAIIRAGYGLSTYDSQAERNASQCELYEIPYGLYWFSYAKNPQEAEQEADSLKMFMRYHRPYYPVYFDFEDDSLRYTGIDKGDRTLISDIANAFCNRVERSGENGCYVGIYTNSDWLINVFQPSLFERYDKWLAHWKSKAINNIFQIPFASHMWQCTSEGVLTNGIGAKVDIDLCDYDYPTLIAERGLNKL